jgi:hypothetical protein
LNYSLVLSLGKNSIEMRYVYPILFALSLILGGLACQSTRLPNAKIIHDPSPQLHYRYVNDLKGFSFDFPYYGYRFFTEMDKKAAILVKNLGVKAENVQFYNSTYLSNHLRLMVVLYEKPEKPTAIIADNLKRLQRKKLFSQVAFIEKPAVKIYPNESIVINDYVIQLDSNIALAQLKYHAQLDKSEFLCSEYYVELKDKSLLRFINFTNIDPALFDESDSAIDSSWFYGHTVRFDLAFFKQPIPPLNLKGDIQNPTKLALKTAENALKNPYLEPLAALQRDSLLYDTLRPEFKGSLYENLTNYYSFLGMNEEALAMRDTAVGVSRPDSCNQLIFNELKVENALNFVSRQLPNRRILMLNEAKHMPICRLFAMQLLDSLRQKGFHYLAIETLNKGHKINKNGYPILSDGYYSQEPMYAEFIRQAVLKGFKIIAYGDTTEILPPPDAHRFYRHNKEEERAADRIATIFKKDPKAKVFIYVEDEQMYKDYFVAQRKRSEVHKWKFMAMYLKDKLGYDPLSINQSDLVERSSREFENPLHRCVWQAYSPEESWVLTQRNGKSWSKPDFETMLDAYIFHPKTGQEIPYEWLGKMGFKKHDFDVKSLKDGYLTQVFYKNELETVGIKAIPALNLPMRGEDTLGLWLRPNTAYVVRVFSRDSRLLKEVALGVLP